MSENRNIRVPRWARLGLFALVPVLALGVFLWAANAGKAQPSLAATPTAGGTAIEFVGRIDQNASNFASYGYITYVSGLDPSVLFTDPVNHSEATARVTYYATGQLAARSVISSVFVLNTTGPTTFYFHDQAGASFNNPASFQAGSQIATFTSRLQNITNVQSPNAGISTNMGDVLQTSSTAFSFNSQTFTLGQVGLAMHSFFTGEGTRTNPVAPDAFIVGAGNLSPIGYQVNLPIITKH